MTLKKTKSWTNPSSNPSLVCQVDGYKHVEIWAQSISAGKTVLIQGSLDGTNFRDIEELATVALNGINQVHKGYLNAYDYVKVTVEETGTGTETIEITASD